MAVLAIKSFNFVPCLPIVCSSVRYLAPLATSFLGNNGLPNSVPGGVHQLKLRRDSHIRAHFPIICLVAMDSKSFPVIVHPFTSPTPFSCAYERGNTTSRNALVYIGGLISGPQTCPQLDTLTEALGSHHDLSYSFWEFRAALIPALDIPVSPTTPKISQHWLHIYETLERTRLCCWEAQLVYPS